MNAALVAAGLALGAAAAPHCALMCGAPCAAVTRGRARDTALFHAGRLAGYAAGGAVAGGATAWLGAWTQATPWLAPLWTLLQLAFLGLGLWWLATGRMPARLLRDGASPTVVRACSPWRATGAGLAWVAWPCGVLQGALLLAALGGGAAGGAAVMAAFALASGPALVAAPALWSAWRRIAGRGQAEVRALGYRVAGAALSVTAAIALTHALHERIAALCQG
ncbi:MAG: urease accessory protein UreH domain-containing protein [Burkholderiaceae bacterium]